MDNTTIKYVQTSENTSFGEDQTDLQTKAPEIEENPKFAYYTMESAFIVVLTILANIVLYGFYKNKLTSSSRKHLLKLMLVDVIGTCVTRYYDVIATQTRDHDIELFSLWSTELYVIVYHLVLLSWAVGIARKTFNRLDREPSGKFSVIVQVVSCFMLMQLFMGCVFVYLDADGKINKRFNTSKAGDTSGAEHKNVEKDLAFYLNFMATNFEGAVGMLAFVSLFFVSPFLLCTLVFRPVKYDDAEREKKHITGLGLLNQLAFLYFVYIFSMPFSCKAANTVWELKHVICWFYLFMKLLMKLSYSYIKEMTSESKMTPTEITNFTESEQPETVEPTNNAKFNDFVLTISDLELRIGRLHVEGNTRDVGKITVGLPSVHIQ